MNKKTGIQVLMVILIAIIFLSFYFKYFKEDSKELLKNTQNREIDIDKNISANYIDNIDYTSLDAKGNKYQITAKQAEIDTDNPDVMFLENVIAYIFVKDSNTMKITSDFGKYNSKNYDTIFSKNVIVVYPSHKITGEYLDFSFLSNLGTISTDVIYTNNKTRLVADRVEMNISTKDTKIFMNDNNKKVLIEGIK
jgi:LPS export ABC transporter protein LptC